MTPFLFHSHSVSLTTLSSFAPTERHEALISMGAKLDEQGTHYSISLLRQRPNFDLSNRDNGSQ